MKLFLGTLMMSSMALAAGATKGAPADATVSANVMAANQAEIDAGKLAESKATNPQVKAFAKHMVEEHSANSKQAATLDKEINVKPSPDDKIAAMKADARQKLETLKTKSGADFDKAYIDMQVAMHEQVLSEIENKLLPMAKNPELKTFLNTTKTHVQQHLAGAKKIQSMLK